MNKRCFLQFLPLDATSEADLIQRMIEKGDKPVKQPFSVMYANVHSYMTAKDNRFFLDTLRASDIVYPDGWGIVLASQWAGLLIQRRMTAYDFFPQFLEEAERQHVSLYLLGSTNERMKKTMETLKHGYPNLQIQGYHHGYAKTKKEERDIIQDINRKKPDILLIGMGTPKQELWTHEHKHQLDVRIIWCVGGLFDYLSGDVKHCPQWIGDKGFQWLWRLTHEPKRLWKRYLLELPEFFIYSMKAIFSRSV